MESSWTDFLPKLRAKWSEIPVGLERVNSKALADLSDSDLLSKWREGLRIATEGDEGFSSRGWYHELYAPILKGKRVLDVGSGFGMDAITFARGGAEVTCLDIAESNLKLVERIADLNGLSGMRFVYLEDSRTIDGLAEYDFIWCQGSMLHVPFELAKQEASALLDHLSSRGRWVELAYPEARWAREGRMRFEDWGERTDGGAPWTEWYDIHKLLRRLEPYRFRVILNFEFHNSDFVWFDLARIA